MKRQQRRAAEHERCLASGWPSLRGGGDVPGGAEGQPATRRLPAYLRCLLAVAEEVGALGGREAGDNIAKRVPKCLDGSQCLGSQEGFELGESLLDRVQIGT